MIQRRITGVQFSFLNNRVSSVTYDTSKRAGAHTGGQHTTAYVVFCETVRNRLMGKTLSEALDELILLFHQVTYLPTVQSSKFTKSVESEANEWIKYAKSLKTDKDTEASDVVTVANAFINIRNSLDRASYKNSSPTHSGVVESGPAGILRTIDDKIRRSEKVTYTKNEVLTNAWDLFHFDPGKAVSSKELAALAIQHAYSMMLAYPHIPELESTKGMLDCAPTYMWMRVVMPSYMDSNFKKEVHDLLKNYLTKNQIPQYLKTIQNDYDDIIGKHGYSLV